MSPNQDRQHSEAPHAPPLTDQNWGEWVAAVRTGTERAELHGRDRRGNKTRETDISWRVVKIACAFVVGMALVGILVTVWPSRI
jgi:hypothetical protein